MSSSDKETGYHSAREKFLGLSLASTRKSYYPQLKAQLEAVSESEARFRAHFESAPVGMAIIDTQRRFLEVNAKICEILGYRPEEMLGRSFNDFTHPDDHGGGRERWRQLLEGEATFNRAEKRYVHKDGRTLWVIVSNALIRDQKGAPLYFVSHLVDVTEQKLAQEEKERLEKKLQQSQKMEAIGTLAGGIAHDFNNLLMGILGRVSLMSLDLRPDHPFREHVKGIEEHVQSATALTRQLLGFARGGKYDLRPLDVNALVTDTATMFGRTKKEIDIQLKLHDAVMAVTADRNQIEQVLLNLYVNAWQAMPEGGAVYLETRNANLDEAYFEPHHMRAGDFVKLSVTDTGIGMDPATCQRIFDPFFTTKEKGRGTGLGLASVYGIVKNHGGLVTVYSELGHGTTFNIYLPATRQKVLSEEPPAGRMQKGSETVLLVDDEAMIIEVGQALLAKLGYTVITATSGQAAVEEVRQREEIDLVILDLIMPGMDGGQTFERIREIAPQLAVLLSSGYAVNGKATDILARGADGFIQKPFNLNELSEKVRTVLENKKC